MAMRMNTSYYAARIRASERRPELSNRERASRELFISADVLYNYEAGVTSVPCSMVERMIEIYGDEQLRLDHVAENCPLMVSCQQVSNLERAALQLVLGEEQMHELISAFARIAADGRITPDERGCAVEARDRLLQAHKKLDAAITALNQTLHE